MAEIEFDTCAFDTQPVQPQPGAMTLPAGVYLVTLAGGSYRVSVPAGATVTIEPMPKHSAG